MPRHLWQELKTAIIPRRHTCPKDLVSYRNISNILEEAPSLLDKLEFVVVGARDFSPEITVLPIGTEVPCSDRVPPQIPLGAANAKTLSSGSHHC